MQRGTERAHRECLSKAGRLHKGERKEGREGRRVRGREGGREGGRGGSKEGKRKEND